MLRSLIYMIIRDADKSHRRKTNATYKFNLKTGVYFGQKRIWSDGREFKIGAPCGDYMRTCMFLKNNAYKFENHTEDEIVRNSKPK